MGAIVSRYPPLRALFKQSDALLIQPGTPSSPRRDYLAIGSRDITPCSPLPLTPKHEESLNRLQQQIVSFPPVASWKEGKPRRASIMSSIANLTNSIIGAGILGLPFAMSKAGIVVAFALILFFAGLTYLSLYYLMYCSKHFPLSGHSSFYSLSMVFLPRPFIKMMDVAVAFNCFGFMVSYLMISGDMFQSLAQQIVTDKHSIVLNRELLISLFLVIFIMPLVQFKHLDNFKFVSIIAVLCFIWITTVIVLYAFAPHIFTSDDVISPTRHDVELNYFPTEFLSFVGILPIYTFGFLCHQNAFSITNELSNNNMTRLNIINISTISIVSLMYALVSVSSYYSFGDEILSDALNNYPQDQTVFIVSRVLLVLALLFSFPTASHPARDSISSLLFKVKAERLNKWRYNALTYGIVLLAYGIAMLVQDIAMVFSFIGATAGTIISYIYPGLIYYFMFRGNPSHRFLRYCIDVGCVWVCTDAFCNSLYFPVEFIIFIECRIIIHTCVTAKRLETQLRKTLKTFTLILTNA
eukprot:375961_1